MFISSVRQTTDHARLYPPPVEFDFSLADQPVFRMTAGAFTSHCETLQCQRGTSSVVRISVSLQKWNARFVRMCSPTFNLLAAQCCTMNRWTNRLTHSFDSTLICNLNRKNLSNWTIWNICVSVWTVLTLMTNLFLVSLISQQVILLAMDWIAMLLDERTF